MSDAVASPAPEGQVDHLLLGISREGLFKFMKYELEFPKTYTRPDSLDWIRQEQHRCGQPDALTGYDFGEAIKQYLTRTGNEGRSVCEVLLMKRGPIHAKTEETWSMHVGRAQVFYSHMQLLPIERTLDTLSISVTELIRFRRKLACRGLLSMLGDAGDDGPGCSYDGHTCSSGRLGYDTSQILSVDRCVERRRSGRGQIKFWVDYTTLRQCRPDFTLPRIAAVIKSLGTVLAEVDQQLRYIDRSFCIFEVYAALVASSDLICVARGTPTLTSHRTPSTDLHWVYACCCELRRLRRSLATIDQKPVNS
jgi:hypothetical protein